MTCFLFRKDYLKSFIFTCKTGQLEFLDLGKLILKGYLSFNWKKIKAFPCIDFPILPLHNQIFHLVKSAVLNIEWVRISEAYRSSS